MSFECFIRLLLYFVQSNRKSPNTSDALTRSSETSAVEMVLDFSRRTTVGHVLTATYHRHVTSMYRHDVIVGGLRHWRERAKHCIQQAN